MSSCLSSFTRRGGTSSSCGCSVDRRSSEVQTKALDPLGRRLGRTLVVGDHRLVQHELDHDLSGSFKSFASRQGNIRLTFRCCGRLSCRHKPPGLQHSPVSDGFLVGIAAHGFNPLARRAVRVAATRLSIKSTKSCRPFRRRAAVRVFLTNVAPRLVVSLRPFPCVTARARGGCVNHRKSWRPSEPGPPLHP